eukprot:TRINITY_DN533_c0_g1_i5.p1 TRINITY_DN533_c0_g1~~TRINITY_DN533_c0_g1_i5.p1  ORF type:complete len:223 (-),score=35.25 TRINITY_DN533_c0_g1_i5:73-741(-)
MLSTFTRHWRFKACHLCRKSLSQLVCDPRTDEDIHATENPFLLLLQGSNRYKNNVLFRDDEVMIIEDKYKVGKEHLLCIPTREIPDISHLRGKEDLQMLKKLQDVGMDVLIHKIKREKKFPPAVIGSLNEHVIQGFSFPVSVYQLHLHMCVPPLRHLNLFGPPRFHHFSQIIHDLEVFGVVKTFAALEDEAREKKKHKSLVINRHFDMIDILKKHGATWVND